MVAYSFDKRFVPKILAGLEPGRWMPGMKRHTIRANRLRHARSGEDLQLYLGMRTKNCKKIGTARCVGIGDITIDIVRNQITLARPRRAITKTAELDAFAQRDGFDDWRAMGTFWLETHGAVEPFKGRIISWVPTSAPKREIVCASCGCWENDACPEGCGWHRVFIGEDTGICTACREAA